VPCPPWGQRAVALRNLGARSRRSPPVLRAAEEAPDSTPATQTPTSPSGEGGEFRGETAAAQNRSFSQFPDQARELAFQIRELALQIGYLKDKLADQSAQQSERAARLESVLEKLAAQSAQQAAQSAQLAAQSAQQSERLGRLESVLEKLADQSAQQSERMARLESSLGTTGGVIAFLVTAVPVALMFLQKK